MPGPAAADGRSCGCKDLGELDATLSEVSMAREMWEQQVFGGERDGEARGEVYEQHRQSYADEHGLDPKDVKLDKVGGITLSSDDTCTPWVDPDFKKRSCDELWQSTLAHETAHCTVFNKGRLWLMAQVAIHGWRGLEALNEMYAHRVQEAFLSGKVDALRRRCEG
jgi:hypothetical protein